MTKLTGAPIGRRKTTLISSGLPPAEVRIEVAYFEAPEVGPLVSTLALVVPAAGTGVPAYVETSVIALTVTNGQPFGMVGRWADIQVPFQNSALVGSTFFMLEGNITGTSVPAATSVEQRFPISLTSVVHIRGALPGPAVHDISSVLMHLNVNNTTFAANVTLTLRQCLKTQNSYSTVTSGMDTYTLSWPTGAYGTKEQISSPGSIVRPTNVTFTLYNPTSLYRRSDIVIHNIKPTFGGVLLVTDPLNLKMQLAMRLMTRGGLVDSGTVRLRTGALYTVEPSQVLDASADGMWHTFSNQVFPASAIDPYMQIACCIGDFSTSSMPQAHRCITLYIWPFVFGGYPVSRAPVPQLDGDTRIRFRHGYNPADDQVMYADNAEYTLGICGMNSAGQYGYVIRPNAPDNDAYTQSGQIIGAPSEFRERIGPFGLTAQQLALHYPMFIMLSHGYQNGYNG